MKHKLATSFLAVTLALLTQAAVADGSHPPITPAAAPATSSMADMYTLGEIRKVDTAQGKLTIKHGDIKNLGMPGMTMIFKVQSPQMLDGLKAGDAVQFVVERQNGALLITELKKTPAATGK